jgi:hypothetical protein
MHKTLKSLPPCENFIVTLNVTSEITDITFEMLCSQILQEGLMKKVIQKQK